MMKFKKKRATTVGWWILSLIPVLNWYWLWRVSKILAHIEED